MPIMDLDALATDLDRRTADHAFRGVALVRRGGEATADRIPVSADS